MSKKIKPFFMRFICFIMILEIITPYISSFNIYADTGSLTSAQRAEKEAMEEELEQAGEQPVDRRKRYLNSSCDPVISLTDRDSYLINIRNTTINGKKSLHNNWGCAHWSDGIAYNKFHIEVQNDIRSSSKGQIDDKEFTIKYDNGKTYHADLWQVSGKKVYLWEVKPESYAKLPNREKGEQQLERYTDPKNKNTKIYAGNSLHINENYANYDFGYGANGGTLIKPGEFFFTVKVERKKKIEYLLYNVNYEMYSNSLVIYHFDRYKICELEKEKEKEKTSSTETDTSIEIDPNTALLILLWLLRSRFPGRNNWNGGTYGSPGYAYSYNWSTDSGDWSFAQSGFGGHSMQYYQQHNVLMYDLSALYCISAAAGLISYSLRNNIDSVSATIRQACRQFCEKISPLLACVSVAGSMPPSEVISKINGLVNDFLLSIEVFISEDLALMLKDALIAGDVDKINEILDEIQNGEDEFDKASKARPPRDPLVIDLGEKGIDLHSLDNGVYFDLDNNGFAEKTAWIGTEDGFLALDRNSNGKIDNGGELFGDQVLLSNGSKSVSGFDALKELDSDGNGLINSNDVSYGHLLVWIDSNNNGRSENEELFSLSDLGIENISLDFRKISIVDEETGTRIADTADVIKSDGVTQISEFWFPIKSSDSMHNDKKSVGSVPDIMQAIEEDKTGKLQGYFDKFSEAADVSTKYYYLKKILYNITDSGNIAPESRGSNIDARDLNVIETFMGRDFEGVDGEDPNSVAAPILKNLYNRIEEDYYCTLNMYCAFGGYLHATYEYVDEDGNVKLSLDFLDQILAEKKANGENIDCLLYDLGLYLKAYDRMNGSESYQDYGKLYKENYPEIVDSVTDRYTYICTEEDDEYTGTSFNDNIFGLGGNDILSGADGNDMLCGGADNDELYGKNGNDQLYGEDSNDKLYGSYGNDVIDGGAGTDWLDGGKGDDIYIFGRGYGEDTIWEGNYDDNDRVKFKNDITPDDIILSREDDSMILSIKDTNDRLIISNVYRYNCHDQWVELFEFADGTVKTIQDYFDTPLTITGEGTIEDFRSYHGTRDAILIGSDNDDIIYGYSGNDIIDGKKGNDKLYGGENDDTYIFGRGYGNDTIWEGSVWDNDKIIFKDDISPDDIIVSRDGENSENLTLHIKDSDDSISILSANAHNCNDRWVETFEFADGTIKTIQEYFDTPVTITGEGEITDNPGEYCTNNSFLIGSDNDDSIYGRDGNDTLDGKGGNDWLDGGKGDDIYIFGRGYGEDTIWEGSVWDKNDKIVFKEDITPEDIILSREDDNMILSIKDTNDRLIISNVYRYKCYDQWVEFFEFADGTVKTIDDYFAIPVTVTGEGTIKDFSGYYGTRDAILIGSDGDDTIYGYYGNDTLDGRGGDDRLEGYADNDTYIFGLGYGHDTILEAYTSENDKIIFRDGITPENLSIAREDNNLVISVNNTEDSITIINYYVQTCCKVETFEFSDGTVAEIDAATSSFVIVKEGSGINNPEQSDNNENEDAVNSESENETTETVTETESSSSEADNDEMGSEGSSADSDQDDTNSTNDMSFDSTDDSESNSTSNTKNETAA